MGNPMNGDIYEGMLRPGDVGLSEQDAAKFKEMGMKDRITAFQNRFREQGALAPATDAPTRPMPLYKCHKEVWALRIASVEAVYVEPRPTIAELEALLNSEQESPALTTAGKIIGGYRIIPADEGYAPFEIDSEYMNKHRPEAGGYFVVYADGYKSYSPAKAFEEGYTRI